MSISIETLDSVLNDQTRPTAQLHSISNELQELAKQQIEFAKPIITFGGQPALYRRSITAIQGKKGSHKSRFAEHLISVLVSDDDNISIGGIERDCPNKPILIFIDTERSIRDAMPLALQRIKRIAGIPFNDDFKDFYPTSLILTPRKERLAIVKDYIFEIRELHPDREMILLIDIMPDIIGNSNDLEQSNVALDYLNELINLYDISVITVSHENPDKLSNKASGHLGTLGQNKASIVLQISYSMADDLVYANYLHIRNHKNPGKFALKLNEESLQFELLSEANILQVSNEAISTTAESVKNLLANGVRINQTELVKQLMILNGISKNVASERLKEIRSNPDRFDYKIELEKEGRTHYYSLSQVAF